MFNRNSLLAALVLASFTLVLQAEPFVLAVDGFAQFGTIDLVTGTFHPSGVFDAPEGGGLSGGPMGGLFSLGFAGNLYSVSPTNGATSLIGPTGLDSCAQPGDPCGPTSANTLGFHGGTLYAADFSNNLYSVNPATGHATLLGQSGLPALPFIPQTENPDGSFNFFDEALFSIGGNFYATFGAGTFNPATFEVTPVIPAALYGIDPATVHATFIGATAPGLHAVVGVNGTAYAFSAATHQILTLDLTNGQTAFFSDLDPGVGVIAGAVATPEPGCVWLAALGLAVIAVVRCRRIGLA